jgi:hypothetical protein
LRQSIYDRLVGYEYVRDAEPLSKIRPFDLSADLLGADLGTRRGTDFAPALVEAELLSQDEHLDGLNKINREVNCEGRGRGLAQTTGDDRNEKRAGSVRKKGHWVYNPDRAGFKVEIPDVSVPLRIWPNFI